MKKIVVLLFSLFLFFGCNPVITVNIEPLIQKQNAKQNPVNYQSLKNDLIEKQIESMTLESKIAQMLLISVDGTSNSENVYLYKDDYAPGGFLLFRYNVDSAEYKAIKNFTDYIKNEYTSLNQISPYVAIDHEGGDVNRLQKVMPHLPSQQYIAEHFSIADAGAIYYYHAKMLEKLGINVNLAPVNEIKTAENLEFLVNRSFGDNKKVYEYGNAEIWNIIRTSVLTVQKHFPGNTNEDTHTGRSVINSSLDVIQDLYIAPFRDVRNLNQSAVMMSHTVLEVVESKPSCISDKTISFFKDNTGFGGLLFTDDLTMDALIKDGYPMKRAILEAIKSGVDVIMLSVTNYIRIVDSVINDIKEDNELIKKVDRAVERILNWKIDCGLVGIDLFSETPSLVFDKQIKYTEEDEDSFNDYYEKAENLWLNNR
ncbi:MAG: glycoside hydrolase family 3 protein [Spirochaetaceae bacterium]|nr:glycoside hydrolase family 3 protein [Spirochaetaceae bacterium]